jgi:hypothetical protein
MKPDSSKPNSTTPDRTDAALVREIETLLATPAYFRDVLVLAKDQPYRTILRAWSDVRTRLDLERDELGRYWIKR